MEKNKEYVESRAQFSRWIANRNTTTLNNLRWAPLESGGKLGTLGETSQGSQIESNKTHPHNSICEFESNFSLKSIQMRHH